MSPPRKLVPHCANVSFLTNITMKLLILQQALSTLLRNAYATARYDLALDGTHGSQFHSWNSWYGCTQDIFFLCDTSVMTRLLYLLQQTQKKGDNENERT